MDEIEVTRKKVGRKPNTPNKITQALRQRLKEKGHDPAQLIEKAIAQIDEAALPACEHCLRSADPRLVIQGITSILPYLIPRLTSTQVEVITPEKLRLVNQATGEVIKKIFYIGRKEEITIEDYKRFASEIERIMEGIK